MHNLKDEDITRIMSNLVERAQTLSQLGEISLILRLLNDNPDSDKKKIALAQEVIAKYLNNTLSTAISPPKPQRIIKGISTTQLGKLYHDFAHISLIQSMKSDIIFEFNTEDKGWLELTEFDLLETDSNFINFKHSGNWYFQIRHQYFTYNNKRRPLYSFYCHNCGEWTSTSQYPSSFIHLVFPVKCKTCNTEICRIKHFPSLETPTTIDGVNQTPS